ncbi:hypothetical protein OIO90_000962 [Microbotryomycetes sp. JL221]|nr:hypothetical protein OIO90_000962 [Microbotryomycetes sp. JL221]
MSWRYSSSTKRPRASPSPPPLSMPYTLDVNDVHSRSMMNNTTTVYVMAHEATLIKGHEALARQTEDPTAPGTRLIKWSGQTDHEQPVWIDKYDALNLLPTLPFSLEQSPPSPAPSSTGFSDMPSDSEELFYFDQQTREDIARDKKRRRLERERDERIRQIDQATAREQEQNAVQDEEPSQTQLDMMRKLNSTLLAATDPKMLEIRIMTKYSTDERFDFLKKNGRFRKYWEQIREDSRQKQNADKEAELVKSTLVGYGCDSDNDQAEDCRRNKTEPALPPSTEIATTVENGATAEVNDDSTAAQRKKREERAAKAKAWAERRKAERAQPVPSTE